MPPQCRVHHDTSGCESPESKPHQPPAERVSSSSPRRCVRRTPCLLQRLHLRCFSIRRACATSDNRNYLNAGFPSTCPCICTELPAPVVTTLMPSSTTTLCHVIRIRAPSATLGRKRLLLSALSPCGSPRGQPHLVHWLPQLSQTASFRNGCCQMMFCHPCHAALNNRVFNPQHFCDLCFIMPLHLFLLSSS